MQRVVIVICDGHRDDFVRPDLCPTIARASRSGRRFRNHKGIYPSATRASVASFATGCWPGAHGLAGNTLALDEGDGLALYDAGHPSIFDALRRVHGRPLRRPTTSARVVDAAGKGVASLIVSNGSPGAARFHDPLHHGKLLNRAGSFAPGGATIETPVAISGRGADADRAAAILFCDALLSDPRIIYAVLWLCEPDTTMHETELGSADHHAAIAAADACVGLVVDTVAELQERGDDVLLLVGSDHGQETVAEAIPVEQLLIDAGLKESRGSPELVVAPQGSSGH
ncbi:MAG: alkaline phosphatase family protein, partial [Pseudomonadota bacterium]